MTRFRSQMCWQWRAEGRCERCDGPGIHPGGIQGANFREKYRYMNKKEEKMSLSGYDAAQGASKERIFLKCESLREKLKILIND